MKKAKTRRVINATTRIIVSLTAAVLVFFCSFLNVFSDANFYFSDIFYQNTSSISMDIDIIRIDEKTLQALGSYVDWKRDVYVELMDRLIADGCEPAVIGYDILFTGEKDTASDAEFAKACGDYGRVVVAASLELADGVNDEYTNFEKNVVQSVSESYPALNDVTISGFANDAPGDDGFLRSTILKFEKDGQEYDSFDYQIYKEYCDYTGIAMTDIDATPGQSKGFRYTTEPGGISHYSLIDVLNGEYPAQNFDNRIVLVGAFATGFRDHFYVPTDRGEFMYGVEIHANIIEALHKGWLVNDIDRTLCSAIAAVLIGVIVWLVSGFELLQSSLITVIPAFLWLFVGRLLYKYGKFLRPFYFPVAVLIAFLGAIVLHYVSARADKRKINKAFKMYVAPQIVDEVAKSGSYELKLGGQTKDIAVLFIDIRGFTTMSENMEPETVVEILNEYFAIITSAIFKNGGTLDKFIGDAAMAVFNSPFDLEDYEYKAVHTAVDIMADSEELCKRLNDRFGKTINFGIGVHCGPATIGNIGCEFRMDYTAIGDTVNTSSRLESNAKGGQILISEEMKRRLGDRIDAEDGGELKLKGKANLFRVYNVTAVHDLPQPSPEKP